jgi:hypothetical protein
VQTLVESFVFPQLFKAGKQNLWVCRHPLILCFPGLLSPNARMYFPHGRADPGTSDSTSTSTPVRSLLRSTTLSFLCVCRRRSRSRRWSSCTIHVRPRPSFPFFPPLPHSPLLPLPSPTDPMLMRTYILWNSVKTTCCRKSGRSSRICSRCRRPQHP